MLKIWTLAVALTASGAGALHVSQPGAAARAGDSAPAAIAEVVGNVQVEGLPGCGAEHLIAVLVDQDDGHGADGLAEQVYVLQTLLSTENVAPATYRRVTFRYTDDQLEVLSATDGRSLIWLGLAGMLPATSQLAVSGYGLSKQEVRDAPWRLAGRLSPEQRRLLSNCGNYPNECPAGGPGADVCGVSCIGSPPDCWVHCGPGYHACCWCDTSEDPGACCRCKPDGPRIAGR